MNCQFFFSKTNMLGIWFVATLEMHILLIGFNLTDGGADYGPIIIVELSFIGWSFNCSSSELTNFRVWSSRYYNNYHSNNGQLLMAQTMKKLSKAIFNALCTRLKQSFCKAHTPKFIAIYFSLKPFVCWIDLMWCTSLFCNFFAFSFTLFSFIVYKLRAYTHMYI